MRVLIVFAHPRRESFNHAVLENFTRGLSAGGHTYDVIDLYKIHFDPVIRTRDYLFFADPTVPEQILDGIASPETVMRFAASSRFGFIKKRLAAWWLHGKTQQDILEGIARRRPKDVLAQQTKVAWANAIVFIAPVFWLHFPAILKGWIERVFSYGFAYTLDEEGWAGNLAGRVPLLDLEKALSITTTFFREDDYRSHGLEEAMATTIDSWSLRYPGIKDVDHVHYWAVAAVDNATRHGYLHNAYQLGSEF